MTTETKYYAVWQNGYSIYGVGTSHEKAIEDAKPWLDKPDNLDDELKERYDCFIGGMTIIPIDAELYDTVREYGGDVDIEYDADADIYRVKV